MVERTTPGAAARSFDTRFCNLPLPSPEISCSILPSVRALAHDELCFGARGTISLELGGAGLDVEPSCPDAHRASIEPLSYCIAKTAFGIIPWMPFVPSTTWVT
jgi:hypothetical protein